MKQSPGNKLSPDGLLDVVAKHAKTGNKVHVQLQVDGVMTEREMKRAKAATAALTVGS
ncbi:MAG: hypothetical protein KDB00_13355 [Planctomycetales bacterium]|nr:hypothetical protein [Planctomycetales bacterium]